MVLNEKLHEILNISFLFCKEVSLTLNAIVNETDISYLTTFALWMVLIITIVIFEGVCPQSVLASFYQFWFNPGLDGLVFCNVVFYTFCIFCDALSCFIVETSFSNSDYISKLCHGDCMLSLFR